MSKSEMRAGYREESPLLQARMAGGLWLLTIVTGVGGFLAGAGPVLSVAKDAAATTAKILANEPLFRLGFVFDLISYATYLGATVFIYCVLKPVHRSGSLVAAFSGLAGVAIGSVAWVGHLVPLVLLQGDQHLTGFTTTQLETLSMIALKLEMPVFNIAWVFFGTQCILIGYMIARSIFLPRILGILLAIGGTSYVINSFANFLTPAFGARLTPLAMSMALIGEGSLGLWLLVKGVNKERWYEQGSLKR